VHKHCEKGVVYHLVSVGFPITVPILFLLPFFELFQVPLIIISKKMHPGASPEAVKILPFKNWLMIFTMVAISKVIFQKG